MGMWMAFVQLTQEHAWYRIRLVNRSDRAPDYVEFLPFPVTHNFGSNNLLNHV